MVWIRVEGPEAASVSAAFNGKIDHAAIGSRIAALARDYGGRVDGLRYSDDGIHGVASRKYPALTTVSFEMSGAPLVSNGAPRLDPFVRAFQNLGHIEILVSNVDLAPYRGVTSFRSDALSVSLLQGEPGLYRYDVRVRPHTGPLPSLAPALQVVLGRGSAIAGKTERDGGSRPLGPVLLIIGGALVLAPVIYLLSERRSSLRSSSRPLGS